MQNAYFTASEAARRLSWPLSRLLAEVKRRSLKPIRAGQSANAPMLLSPEDVSLLAEPKTKN